MMLSPPFLVTCPACSATHSHVKMMTCNDLLSEYYSDGFTSLYGIDKIRKCTNCDHIILDSHSLEKLDVVETNRPNRLKAFLKTLLKFKRGSAIKKWPSLSFLGLDDWLRVVQSTNDSELKRYCEKKAMWAFNQRKYFSSSCEHERSFEKSLIIDIENIENSLISAAKSEGDNYLNLMIADIYRRRGDFINAKKYLTTVNEKSFIKKVEQMTLWIEKGSTNLEIYPSVYD